MKNNNIEVVKLSVDIKISCDHEILRNLNNEYVEEFLSRIKRYAADEMQKNDNSQMSCGNKLKNDKREWNFLTHITTDDSSSSQDDNNHISDGNDQECSYSPSEHTQL